MLLSAHTPVTMCKPALLIKIEQLVFYSLHLAQFATLLSDLSSSVR